MRAKSGVEEVLVHTGQHYDENMSDVFFEELEIPHPDHHLGIGSGSHGTQTGRMLEAAERVLLAEEPDLVVVYGDTNSTLAGALAAVKLHIPVAHVEAGLRSFNRRMPEEINRVFTDHASDLLFTPTEIATENLRREGISAESIYRVGDVMYDAALFYADKAKEKEEILKRLQLEPKGYVLATVHRAENTDDLGRLRAIFEGLERVADSSPVIMPLHPRAKKKLSRLGSRNSKIRYLDPVGYLDMISLEKNAAVIATDSGGVQKEAFFYRVPCVTLREETEWTETVASGWNTLAPPDPLGIYEAIKSAEPPASAPPFYGDGTAARHIVEILQRYIAEKRNP